MRAVLFFCVRAHCISTMKRLAFLFLLLAFFTAGESNPPRIVAIGDVHGDLVSFKAILQAAHLIDAKEAWVGGNTIFVQTGDVLDRGNQGTKALDLLMKLEERASKKGGRVYSLLGNHEVLNMMGDFRYVPPEEFAAHATPESEKRLKEAFERYKRFQNEKADQQKKPRPEFTDQMQSDWFKAHPGGFLEYRQAFGPSGRYGKWLRKKDAVAQIQDTVFLHGGISSAVSTIPVREINSRIQQELALFDRLQKILEERKIILPFFTFSEMVAAAQQELDIQKDDKVLLEFLGLTNWLSVSPEGPLWFRGYARWTDEELAASLPPLLKSYNAKRFVVGHTVTQNGQIQTRLSHGAVMIDTGLNRAVYPAGRPSALEIKGEILTAIYPDSRVVLNPQ